MPTTTAPGNPYSYTGGVINGGSVGNNQQVVIYVDGDLTINSDITYSGAGTWADLAQIPSVKVVVSGDIKINRSVRNLSGTFIAQPRADGTGGRIFTCTNGANLYAESQLVANCSNDLTVYGSFVAKSIRFLRVGGHVGQADPGDAFGQGTAAEKFIYGPELWARNTGQNSSDGYDSLTSLPPVF
jgi:hypothetical protein